MVSFNNYLYAIDNFFYKERNLLCSLHWQMPSWKLTLHTPRFLHAYWTSRPKTLYLKSSSFWFATYQAFCLFLAFKNGEPVLSKAKFMQKYPGKMKKKLLIQINCVRLDRKKWNQIKKIISQIKSLKNKRNLTKSFDPSLVVG